jgi:hypothetical protein
MSLLFRPSSRIAPGSGAECRIMKGEYKGKYIMPRSNYHQFLSAIVLAAALSSCAHTKIVNSWKDPEYQGLPKKVLVHGIAYNPDIKAVFENKIVDQLNKHGVAALASHGLLPDSLQLDREAVKKLVIEKEIDTIFVAHPISRKELQTLRPGSVSYSAAVYVDPNSNFVMAAAGPSYKPGTYAEMEGIYELVIYDVNARKRVWTAVVETYVSDTRMEEMKPAIDKIMERLVADKMIP